MASKKKYTSYEICAGAGGQALGLELAGFQHIGILEIEPLACQTLLLNRPEWNVIQADVRELHLNDYNGQIDLLAGGVPCPPFSKAGKQLGHLDERDLFPDAIRLVRECNPKAILLENVKGLLEPKFDQYRQNILTELQELGYVCDWQLLNASDYGVSQLRPRAILIGLKKEYYQYFQWPSPRKKKPVSVGTLLYEEMSSMGWTGAIKWKRRAKRIAPTLVGGSKKHGGADLGPTRAKQAWLQLGVDGGGVANTPPTMDFEGTPKLTLSMTALIQGFPREWQFAGSKTPAYRQIGNAFPPPVAKAVGIALIKALKYGDKTKKK